MKRTVKRTAKPKEKKEVNIAQVVQDKPVDFLTKTKVVTDAQAKQLLALQTKTGKPLVDVNNKTDVFDLLARIQDFGFDDIYQELNQPYHAYHEYTLDKMTEQKKAYTKEVLQRNVPKKTESGLFICKRCQREGRNPKNVTVIQFHYRADEPALNRVICETCGDKRVER